MSPEMVRIEPPTPEGYNWRLVEDEEDTEAERLKEKENIIENILSFINMGAYCINESRYLAEIQSKRLMKLPPRPARLISADDKLYQVGEFIINLDLGSCNRWDEGEPAHLIMITSATVSSRTLSLLESDVAEDPVGFLSKIPYSKWVFISRCQLVKTSKKLNQISMPSGSVEMNKYHVLKTRLNRVYNTLEQFDFGELEKHIPDTPTWWSRAMAVTKVYRCRKRVKDYPSANPKLLRYAYHYNLSISGMEVGISWILMPERLDTRHSILDIRVCRPMKGDDMDLHFQNSDLHIPSTVTEKIRRTIINHDYKGVMSAIHSSLIGKCNEISEMYKRKVGADDVSADDDISS